MAIDFPATPTPGQEFQGYYWDNTKQAWRSQSTNRGSVITSATTPTGATAGDLWFNTVDGTMYVYYDDGITTQWVEIQANVDNYKTPSQNYIINSAFDIWQRGTSSNAAGYVADRWYSGFGISGAATVSRGNITIGEPLLPHGIDYYLSYQQTVAATSATPGPRNYIEDVRTLAGQTVTFSFYAKANKAVSVYPLVRQYFGTGGSPSSQVDTYHSSLAKTLTTSWTRYSTTFTIPGIAGKVLGTNNDSSLVIQFMLPINDTYTVDIAAVQLEEGTIATPFRRNQPNIQAELAACQRYYQRFSALTSNDGYLTVGQGQAQSSTIAHFLVPLITPMRAAPTLSYSNLTDWGAHRPGLTITTANALTIPTTSGSLSSDRLVWVYMTFASDANYAANVPCVLSARGIASAWMAFSAELS